MDCGIYKETEFCIVQFNFFISIHSLIAQELVKTLLSKCNSIQTIYETFLVFRCWETSILKFSNATNSRCGTLAKKLDEITTKEAIRLGYKKHIQEIKNIDTLTIEKEQASFVL